MAKATAELNKDITGIDDSVVQTFLQYSWPGNLREFRNVIRRAVLLTKTGTKISAETMPWEINSSNTFSPSKTEVTITQPTQVAPAFPDGEKDKKFSAPE
jgi:two-component system response regulator HydG